MAHIGEEGRLRLVCLLCSCQSLHQSMVPCHILPHLRVDDRETQAYCVYDVVFPVSVVAHTRHAEHFVVICTVSMHEVAVGDNILGLQPCPYIYRIDELAKALLKLLIHIVVAVPGKPLMVREMNSLRCLCLIIGIPTVADSVIRIDVHMIDAAIVGGHGSNHAVQFLLLLLLGKKLFLKLQLFLQFLLFRTVFGLSGFHSAPVFLAANDGKLNICQDHNEPQCAQIPGQHFSEVSPSAGLFGCQIPSFIRRIDLNLNTAVMNISGMENEPVFVNDHTVVVFLPDSITKQLLVISNFRHLFYETIPVHYQDCQARKPVGGIIDRVTDNKSGPAFDQRMRACHRCLFGLDGKTCRRTLLRILRRFKADGCFVDFQWIGQANHTVGCNVQRTNCVIPLHNMLADARKMIR